MKSQLGFIHITLEYVRISCLHYSKKHAQVCTKPEEFCSGRTLKLGSHMLKSIILPSHCLFPTLGIKVSLIICMHFKCRNGHAVSQQDLFNSISDAVIIDSF